MKILENINKNQKNEESEKDKTNNVDQVNEFETSNILKYKLRSAAKGFMIYLIDWDVNTLVTTLNRINSFRFLIFVGNLC